ncbi:MAG: hypothetical protein U9P50_02635 [Patescibacteria group bacterium]|nr:hypothetical protein [Patescibacteria group bacterium]
MLEVSYNLFKQKGGYKLTVAVTEDDQVIHEEELDSIEGLRKNAIIMRKKHITLNDKVLTFGLNVFNEKNK